MSSRTTVASVNSLASEVVSTVQSQPAPSLQYDSLGVGRHPFRCNRQTHCSTRQFRIGWQQAWRTVRPSSAVASAPSPATTHAVKCAAAATGVEAVTRIVAICNAMRSNRAVATLDSYHLKRSTTVVGIGRPSRRSKLQSSSARVRLAIYALHRRIGPRGPQPLKANQIGQCRQKIEPSLPPAHLGQHQESQRRPTAGSLYRTPKSTSSRRYCPSSRE
jgi:hypothetical protein